MLTRVLLCCAVCVLCRIDWLHVKGRMCGLLTFLQEVTLCHTWMAYARLNAQIYLVQNSTIISKWKNRMFESLMQSPKWKDNWEMTRQPERLWANDPSVLTLLIQHFNSWVAYKLPQCPFMELVYIRNGVAKQSLSRSAELRLIKQCRQKQTEEFPITPPKTSTWSFHSVESLCNP